jgi:hypothetical protein
MTSLLRPPEKGYKPAQYLEPVYGWGSASALKQTQ